MEILEALSQTPLPTVLVLGGFAFIILANLVGIRGLEVRAGRHAIIGGIGFLLFSFGVGLYAYEKLYIPYINSSKENNDNQREDRGEIVGKESVVSSAWVYNGRWNADDFIFRLVNSDKENCPGGYWIRTTNSGYIPTINLVNSALVGGLKVRAYGVVDEKYRWKGSKTKTCSLYQVTVIGSDS